MSSPLTNMTCSWCGEDISVPSDCIQCPNCQMPLIEIAPKIQPKAAPRRKAPVKKSTDAPEVVVDVSVPAKTEHPVMIVGIDPGARYTGFSIIDGSGELLFSSTFIRPQDEEDLVAWSKALVRLLEAILKDVEYVAIGIEGVSHPKGFKKGVKSSLNPKDIIRTALVVGALSMYYDKAHIIPPGRNGDRALEEYPEELIGRRPKNLPGSGNGAGTRRHEMSAYDVALKTLAILNQQ